MLDAERIPLPPGLPAHLSVGKEGYDTLCALLDVATQGRRQALASATFVKQFLKAAGNAPTRHVKTAERTRQSLLALYSDPDARRRIWRNVRHHESTDKAGGTPLPSLEHAALSRYDAALLTAEPDPERLANSDAFYVPELGSDDWRAPALAALPRLRDDFADWSSAPSARGTEIIAAAFATATLLDDARLLRWAADPEDDIAREYAFLDKASAASGADEDTSATDGARGDLPARPTFLGERMEEGLLRRLKPTSDANGLVGVLNRLRPDRDTYVCLVDDDEPWTLRWLDRAADALRKAQRGRKLRVVFCADPDQLWRFLEELPDEYVDADNDLFDWVAAQPWNAAFLRRWCSDLQDNLGVDQGDPACWNTAEMLASNGLRPPGGSRAGRSSSE